MKSIAIGFLAILTLPLWIPIMAVLGFVGLCGQLGECILEFYD